MPSSFPPLGIESVSVAEHEQAAMNAAEAGLFYGIDRFPFLARERGIRLPNGARYDVMVSHSGMVPVPGYDMGWAQALFRVRADRQSPERSGDSKDGGGGSRVRPRAVGDGTCRLGRCSVLVLRHPGGASVSLLLRFPGYFSPQRLRTTA